MSLAQHFRTKFQGVLDNLQFDNGLGAIVHRALLRKSPLLVYKKGPLSFVVDFSGGDENGTRRCVASDMYSRFFGALDRGHPLKIVDVGANGGGFPLCLLDRGFEIAKAVCVEMNPNTYVRLAFNLGYNLGRRAVAVNAAATAHDGSMEIAESWGGTSESIYAKTAGAALTSIRTMSLDSIVGSFYAADESLDLIKIDIEGAEYEMLLSDTCRSITRFKFLIIEIHMRPGYSSQELVDRISALGFRLISDPGTRTANAEYFFRNEGSGTAMPPPA
jgi:FkbM family methyltransferase